MLSSERQACRACVESCEFKGTRNQQLFGAYAEARRGKTGNLRGKEGFGGRGFFQPSQHSNIELTAI